MERKGVVTMKGAPVTLLGPELDVGEKVPGFTVLDRSLKEVTLDDFEGKIKVISVTPSLDTPVCDLQAHWFNEEASSLPGDVAVLNVSM
ncbi:MAG: redoxin domain-containing protein, partial [Synergistaceae bacterium]|nr:redoxin domain-containing protein [Synergistaceae bacterium]